MLSNGADTGPQAKGGPVAKRVASMLVLLVMVGLIVGLDIAFLRHHFWPRLIVNVAIVGVFTPLSLRFLKRS